MARRRKPAARRRKPGTGYTTQAKSGTRNAYFPRRGGGYHVRKGFATKAEAEAWLDSLLKQRAARVDVGSGQQRVRTWTEQWIERNTKDREWKAKMVADVVFKLEYVIAHIGDMALADVLPDDVDVMMDELACDLAPNTIRQIRNYLYQVFESAVKRRYITYNPVIKPERHKRPKQKEPQRLSASQSALLIRTAEPSFYALAWWLILTLGLRAGEVCGLRWGDLDLDNGIIHILQEVTDVRGKAHKDMPKGDKVRHLPLPRALVPLFRLHKQTYTRRADQGQQRGYWQENGLVFPGRGGKPMNPTSLRHQLKRLTDTCHLPPVTTHMLRHTAGKFYTDLGAPQHITQAVLGHAPNITGHYAPPDAEAMRPWVDKVYGLLSGEVENARRAAM